MAQDKATFREIEHTADLGIEVEAADLSGLFSCAGEAFYGLIADRSGIGLNESMSVSIRANGCEELFHAWLCELLAQFNLKGFIGKRCEVTKIEPGLVEGQLTGEVLDLKRHRFHTEIKGVTYHGFKVWEEKGGWRARVIFDV